VDHPPCKPLRHREPTTSTQAGVSREHPSAREPRPSFSTATAPAGDYNVRHVNLDAHQHSVGREPLRPASRARASARTDTRRAGELQRAARQPRRASALGRPRATSTSSSRARASAQRRHRPVSTTCGTSTSTRISTSGRPSPFDQAARARAFSTATHRAGDTTCARQPRRASALGRREPLQPARRARASAQRQHRAGEYNVRHVNLDAHRRSAGREPLRPASRARASAQ
jgi:hypothetical protein